MLGGVQAGFNWRMAPQWIFGIEADIQAIEKDVLAMLREVAGGA